MIDAFGTIALVAMTPTITIQILGLIYKAKRKHSEAAEAELDEITVIYVPDAHSTVSNANDDYDSEIIEFPSVEEYSSTEG